MCVGVRVRARDSCRAVGVVWLWGWIKRILHQKSRNNNCKFTTFNISVVIFYFLFMWTNHLLLWHNNFLSLNHYPVINKSNQRKCVIFNYGCNQDHKQGELRNISAFIGLVQSFTTHCNSNLFLTVLKNENKNFSSFKQVSLRLLILSYLSLFLLKFSSDLFTLQKGISILTLCSLKMEKGISVYISVPCKSMSSPWCYA